MGDVRILEVGADSIDRLVPLWRAYMVESVATITNWRDPDAEMQAIWVQEMEKHFAEGGTAWVAEDGEGAWVAKLQASIFEPPPTSKVRQMGYIGEVYVEPPFRRQGVAKRLVETAYEWFRAKGLHRAAIYVMEENPGGIEVWKQLGYSHVAHYMTREI